MSESTRMLDGSQEPTEAEVAGFIGKQNASRWTEWVFVSVDSAKVVSDIKQLLTFKRQPKPGRQGRTPRVAPTARVRRQARG